MKINTYLLMAVLLIAGGTGFAAERPSITPKPYDQGNYEGTPWLSGGVGIEERNYLLEKYADDYNLRIEFARTDGSYLADVEVLITAPDGSVVMKQVSTGPWFMTRLPAGSYKVRVTSDYGQTFEETVEVPATGMKTMVFGAWRK